MGLAIVAGVLTTSFDEPLVVYQWGAAGWPRALILLIAVVALVQLAARLGWLGAGRARHDPDTEVGEPGPATAHRAVNLKRAATFALPLLYLVLLPRAGYYLTTPFFLAAYMLVLGERRARHLIGTTLLLYAIVLLVFTRLFFVPLPVGNWPGFYDFGHWFLSFIQ